MLDSTPVSTSSNGKAPLRVGLIGVTGYGLAYFESISKLVDEGRVTWAAVTIINPEDAKEQVEFFRKSKIPIYAEYSEMLAKEKDNLDWVCIPTAIGWHTRMTIDSLKLGLQVLVEKPLAPTLQEVTAIQEAEAEAGVKVGVGFQHSFQKETWEIKERLVSGEIGEIKGIDCLSLWPRSLSYYGRNDWSGHLHHGDTWVLDSPLHNGLSHIINLILFFSGSTLESRADVSEISVETYRSKPLESYDTVRSVTKLDTGVEAAVILSHSSAHKIDPEIHITGTKGKLIWRFLGNYSIVKDGKQTSINTPGQIEVRDAMFESMVDSIEGKPTRICTTEQARGTAKWVNAIHDTAMIHDVPVQYRYKFSDESGDDFEAIKDLEYYAYRAFIERKSFAELEAPWAVPASSRDVSEYFEFEGSFCPKPLPRIPDPPLEVKEQKKRAM